MHSVVWRSASICIRFWKERIRSEAFVDRLGELKYIAEAPRLELEEDEYVDVPAGVKDANRYRGYGKVIGKSGKTKGAKNVHRRGDGESELRQVRAESVTTDWVDCCSHRISSVRRVRNEMICNKVIINILINRETLFRLQLKTLSLSP